MTDKSISILPFINLSLDKDNEYFSDGITEEIILALSKTKGLKVIARTSSFMFKGKNLDVRAIGEQLGVATILEGSVRKSGMDVRISVRLVRTSDGFQIWSMKFDRQLEDIFKLQDEISLLVADKIRENFGHIEYQSSLVSADSTNFDAYDYYLKGRYEQLKWTKDALVRAIEHYRNAIQLDPGLFRAYYGIVLCYTYMLFWSSGEEARSEVYNYLEKAVEVNSDSLDYHIAKASTEMMLEWDHRSSIDHFKRYLEMNPNNAEAIEAIAGMYIMVGQFDEAMIHIERALEINPLSLNHTFMKGNILYFSEEYEKAIQQMNKVLKQDPKWIFAVQLKAAALVLTNNRTELEEVLEEYSEIPFMDYYNTLYRLYHRQPISDYEQPFLADENIHPWRLYFLTLEENYNQAFKMLEEGLNQKHGKYICFNYDPFLAKLRTREEYKNLKEFLPKKFPLLSGIYEDSSVSRPLITDKEEHKDLAIALDKSMEVEELYLNPKLTLINLADHINTSSNKLSWLINQDKRLNFNHFINFYRLEHFKKIAVLPENQNLTLLGIAFECGFNSKTTFNDYFKKNTGLTPRRWLKEQK